VNGAFDGPYMDSRGLGPEFQARARGQARSLKSVFKRVYGSDRVDIYRVVGTSFDRLTWDPVVPYLNPPQGRWGCVRGGAGSSA